jgi:glycosyltransferase involved in cell wall biosynthesis
LIQYGADEHKIVVLPFGVDAHRFQPPPEQPASVTFRVLFVGQVVQRKGVDTLLEAFRQAAQPGAELTIVGGIVEAWGQRIAQRHRTTATWRSALPHREVSAAFQQADVFAFPSLAEGSALVTYEAMASGLPLIVTREAGSVVRDGLDGIVVRRNSIDDVKAALTTLYHDRARARAMGLRARAYVLDNITWQRYRQRMLTLYNAALLWHDRTPDEWRERVIDAIHAVD